MFNALEKLQAWLDKRQGHVEIESVRDGFVCYLMTWQLGGDLDEDGRPSVVGIAHTGVGGSVSEAISNAMKELAWAEEDF